MEKTSSMMWSMKTSWKQMMTCLRSFEFSGHVLVGVVVLVRLFCLVLRVLLFQSSGSVNFLSWLV